MTFPAGYMQDNAGRLVRVESVKPEHLLEDGLVRDLHRQAEELRLRLLALRETAFREIGAFQELLAQKYQAIRGGEKGNLQLQSYDGSLRILVAINDHLAFGPELQVAKSLIDECLDAWSKDANPHLRSIVTDAFDVGKEGRLNVDRILGLRRMNIDDPVWLRAMDAIGDAIRISRSKAYVRFYTRLAAELPYVQLPLDIARV